jgi:hypothetical protein
VGRQHVHGRPQIGTLDKWGSVKLFDVFAYEPKWRRIQSILGFEVYCQKYIDRTLIFG